ncbi:hypothetical protein V8C86DRAFT_1638617 [Haematococcus lacustris]
MSSTAAVDMMRPSCFCPAAVWCKWQVPASTRVPAAEVGRGWEYWVMQKQLVGYGAPLVAKHYVDRDAWCWGGCHSQPARATLVLTRFLSCRERSSETEQQRVNGSWTTLVTCRTCMAFAACSQFFLPSCFALNGNHAYFKPVLIGFSTGNPRSGCLAYSLTSCVWHVNMKGACNLAILANMQACTRQPASLPPPQSSFTHISGAHGAPEPIQPSSVQRHPASTHAQHLGPEPRAFIAVEHSVWTPSTGVLSVWSSHAHGIHMAYTWAWPPTIYIIA